MRNLLRYDESTDTSTVVDHIMLDAYGNIVADSNPNVDSLFGYSGREFDRHTGLQCSRARYYDSTTGRFTQKDPISFAAGDANLYRYVGNSPTNATDPSGLDKVSDAITSSREKYDAQRSKISNRVREDVRSNLRMLREALNRDQLAHTAHARIETLQREFDKKVRAASDIYQRLKEKEVFRLPGHGHDFSVDERLEEFMPAYNAMQKHQTQLHAARTELNMLRTFIDQHKLVRPDGELAPATEDEIIGGTAMHVAESFVPLMGEKQDVEVIFDPDASGFEKSLSAASLVGNIFTGGFLPNAGGFIRAANAADETGGILRSSGRDLIPNRLLRKQPDRNHVQGGSVVDWEVRNGKFYSRDGNPIHFGKARQNSTAGIDFVIGVDGKLRIGDRHTFLAELGGDASQAIAAGTLRIKNGKISSITNLSGHFNPRVDETLKYPEAFRKAGFDVSGVGLEIYVPKATSGIERYTGGVRLLQQQIIQ